MDQDKAIIAIIVGSIMIIASFIGKNFYAARGYTVAYSFKPKDSYMAGSVNFFG